MGTLHKNYWIKTYEQKQNRFWTSEFSHNGLFVLRPRRVQLSSRTAPTQSSGCLGLIFPGAMMDTSDDELLEFILDARKSMVGWVSRLRCYDSLFTEYSAYKFTELTYVSIGSGREMEDMEIKIQYDDMRKIL